MNDKASRIEYHLKQIKSLMDRHTINQEQFNHLIENSKAYGDKYLKRIVQELRSNYFKLRSLAESLHISKAQS